MEGIHIISMVWTAQFQGITIIIRANDILILAQEISNNDSMVGKRIEDTQDKIFLVGDMDKKV